MIEIEENSTTRYYVFILGRRTASYGVVRNMTLRESSETLFVPTLGSGLRNCRKKL